MRLTIRALGIELLHLELTDSTVYETDEQDYSRDLSGGHLSSLCVEAGHTDWHMGFTNGREDE